MSQPSPDARAVVNALNNLTTQVRRLAETRQSDFVLSADVTDDGATTPATTCSAQHRQFDDGRLCIRAAQHHGDHIDERGFHWSDTVAVYPLADSMVRVAHWHPVAEQLAEERRELVGMVGEFIDAQLPPARAADEEQTLRWTRRESLLVLLTRLQRGRALTEEEAGTLRHHVESEIREADTARSVAAGNKRHVQTLVPALQRAEADANHNADQVADAVRRAESAERDLRTLRTGLRAAGGDPTQIQNLWAQLRLRNRQWAEAKREARAFHDMLEDPQDVSLVDEMLATVAKAEERAREAGHERDVIAVDLETADRIRAEAQRDRDQHAAVLREVLNAFSCLSERPGGPPMGHVVENPIAPEQFDRWRSVAAPTVERPWWEQVALYEKEAVEATRHVLELKAAIERVRSYVTDAKARYAHGRNDYEIGKHDLAGTILGALDGTDQPTTEA